MTRKLPSRIWFLAAVPIACLSQQPETSQNATAQAFFAKNCYSCHNAKIRSGGLNLEARTGNVAQREEAEQNARILRRLRAGEMPPKGSPRPDENELKLVTSWIEKELERTEATSLSDRTMVRRLNRVEYNNTVRDLLGVEIQAADDFPPDDSAHGFDNIAQVLSVSPLLMEKYLSAAERIARIAIFGPEAKNLTTTYQQALPRRMETTNLVLVKQPAYYSPTDYDVTGLSHPGSFHQVHYFPVDGEYLIRMAGAGYRPKGSENGEMTFWVDGRLTKTFPVLVEVPSTGFEYRPDHWEVQIKAAAGKHDLVAAFPRQYEGLPPVYGGLKPSTKPAPPVRDEVNVQGLVAAMERETIPERRERRRLEIERAKQQAALPVTLRKETAFPGMSVTQMEVIGPLEHKEGPSSESLRHVFTCGHLEGNHQPSCERKILGDLARRAYRRAAGQEEVDRLVSVSTGARQRGGSFEEGLSVALATLLVSPDFLFRIEGSPASVGGTASARGYELASRLSYFLWSSMPDEELLAAAEQGSLSAPAALRAQVRRMLTSPKASALAENFAGQWLEIRRLKSAQPDRERYPDFDSYLRDSMLRETELFVDYVIREDRSVLDFIDAPYSFLNERLARHYGIRDVAGTDYRRVDLKGTGRGGILTQASVLTVSSYGNRTSPVLRGKWILDNLLNAPPPPPPPNVPSLDEDAVGTAGSLREQLDQHRKDAVCASCHSRMDPLGFALENYDAVGGWRAQDGQFTIDASGSLPDGRSFRGAQELKAILKQEPRPFIEGLTGKLLTYALGRGVEPSDGPAIREITARAAKEDYKFSAILLGVIESRAFMRTPPASGEGK